jgi:hypothetical protein
VLPSNGSIRHNIKWVSQKSIFGCSCIHLAEDRDHGSNILNTIMNSCRRGLCGLAELPLALREGLCLHLLVRDMCPVQLALLCFLHATITFPYVLSEVKISLSPILIFSIHFPNSFFSSRTQTKFRVHFPSSSCVLSDVKPRV